MGQDDDTPSTLWQRPADGTGTPELLLAAEPSGSTMQDNVWQMAFVPGDREIVFRRQRVAPGAPDAGDVWRAPLDGGAAEPLFETSALEEHAVVAPDGRWLAYTSDETGTQEVYVRSYPDMGPRTLVSLGGGAFPVWTRDGSELFYWGLSGNWLVSASLQLDGASATVLDRTRLFRSGRFRNQANRNYDVHPNGQEFVMVGGLPSRIVVRVNALDP